MIAQLKLSFKQTCAKLSKNAQFYECLTLMMLQKSSINLVRYCWRTLEFLIRKPISQCELDFRLIQTHTRRIKYVMLKCLCFCMSMNFALIPTRLLVSHSTHYSISFLFIFLFIIILSRTIRIYLFFFSHLLHIFVNSLPLSVCHRCNCIRDISMVIISCPCCLCICGS